MSDTEPDVRTRDELRRSVVANALGYEMLRVDGRPVDVVDGVEQISVTPDEQARCEAAAGRVMQHLADFDAPADGSRYVVGFLVEPERTGYPRRLAGPRVALIRKNRPTWQAGLLNGIGGKVEPGETPAQAMAREFEEETGARFDGWELMCSITWAEDTRTTGRAAGVDFFRCWARGDAPLEVLVRSMTDEVVHVVLVSELDHYEVVPNLRWLVPLAAYTADHYAPFTVHATVNEVLGEQEAEAG